MPDAPDITAEEILRGMICDRIGSTDPKDIKAAEEFRKLMDGLSRLQGSIDMLDEVIQRAEDPGEPDQIPSDLVAETRELITQCAAAKTSTEDSIVNAWKRGYELGREDSAAAREQVLATVIDLTSRLQG
jgi:hypothetical protein